ncbi:hypothetical protein [Yaniella flava]
MTNQSHWPGGPPPPPPETTKKRRGVNSKETPSWGTDLKHTVIGAVAMSAFWTLLMLLSATGMMKTGSRHVIEPEPLWAAFLAAGGTVAWGFGLVSAKRNDNGFRPTGLPSFLLSAVVLATLIQAILVLLWPLVVDEIAFANTAFIAYASDPQAFVLISVFLLALYAWTTTCSLGFATDRISTNLLGVLGIFVVGGVGVWRAIVIFGNPLNESSIAVWAVIALLGLILLWVLATVTMKKQQGSKLGQPNGYLGNTMVWDRSSRKY